MTAAHPSPGPADRLAYDDASTPSEMSADCRAAGANLHLRRAARAAVRPAPSLRFEDYPRDVAKRDIEISEAAARLAAAMNLQVDGD
ncbi:hypothetical protein [Nocardioides panaciterrulae]|uniref:Uncharacterized protein n=1 Tax=Nocardioides panaciterrulae TaxID=661492 RepID=A0A7Y9E7J3_9ACTN|nr:hypothetical protein [Nocardioides panaciterrulae]NYD42331.1 hypothetical protein [Nocardioides panaciterrulae]